jgi:hypothetical protein
MTIYTAIFGDYDTLKEPLIITPGWKYICYTDQDFESKHWTIKKMLPIGTAQHTARRVKIYFQNYIDDEYSIFIDGSFIVNCNLNAWWRQFKPDMTCIRHPTRNCIYEEAEAVVKNGRKGVQNIFDQIEKYRGIVPPRSGLIQSGILMRKRTKFTEDLCAEWYEEVRTNSYRDQIAFGKVSLNKPIHYISYDYRRGQKFIFKQHKK